MRARRGFRTAVCQECGTAWPGRDARFCGRCGAVLAADDGASPDAGSDLAATDPSAAGVGTRRWWLVVIAVVAIGGAAFAVGNTTGLLEDRPVTEGGSDVELPEASELPSTTDRTGRAGQVGCIPEGCERWRVELPDEGMTWPGEGFVVHTTREGLPVGAPPTVTEDETEGEEADGRHVGSATVTVIATRSGEVRWQRQVELVTLRMSGAGGTTVWGLGSAWSHDDLVLVATADGLAAYGADDGELRWISGSVAGSPGPTGVGHGLIVATHRADRPPPQPGATDGGGPTLDLVRLDPATGEVLWRVEEQRLLGYAEQHVFVEGQDDGSISAIDVATGARAWEREGLGSSVRPWGLQVADGRVVIPGEETIVVASLDTGETILELDGLPGSPRPALLVGNLLLSDLRLRGPGPAGDGAPAPMVLVDLTQPDADPERIEDVAWMLALQSDPAAPFGVPRPEHDGVAILRLIDDTYELRVLDAAGGTRWLRQWDADVGACCWRLHPGIDGGSIVLVPRDPATQPVRILAVDDGATLETFAAPPEVTGADHVSWHGPIATIHGRGGPAVVGPGGRFVAERSGTSSIQGMHREVILVQVDTTLIGIDREVLLGVG